jgi:hypothetical protein
MGQITSQQLAGYLDDSLADSETAQVEQALRQSEPLRRQLRGLMEERDRGEHSIGAIWRRQRLTCPSRAQLGSYLLEALDAAQQEYVDFHLKTIGCSYCLANLTDLKSQQEEPVTNVQQRRKRFFESSAGFLKVCREK